VRGWAAEGREVHVYFDNDAEGHAPYDALKLIAALGNAYQPLSQAEGLP
jgi:uncharacterized protein YecE (DUF72 family)